jgi:uncharacterized protein YkwD
MTRLTLGALLCFVLAACSPTSPAPLAQSAQPGEVIRVAGNSGSADARINAIRAQAGLQAVRRNRTLDDAARAHAGDMAQRNFFSHTGSNGSSAGQRVKAAGYRWCMVAENIAKGYSSQGAAIETWRTSRSHYRNITHRTAREYGLANVGNVWVMVLAAKNC